MSLGTDTVIEYTIDSLGFRGAEVTRERGVIRIVALGSSETFGWGIPEESTYVNILQEMINRDSSLPEVEIINAGVPGYSSYQGKKYYMADIVSLKPDIILLLFGWSDQQKSSNDKADKEMIPQSEWIIDLQNQISRLKLYQILSDMPASSQNAGWDSKEGASRVQYVDFYDNLSVIITNAVSETIAPILLTGPAPSPDNYHLPAEFKKINQTHRYYNMQIGLLARNSRIPLIDLAAEFDKHGDLFSDPVNNPMLFNAEGHRLTAELIYNYLRSHQNLMVRQ